MKLPVIINALVETAILAMPSLKAVFIRLGKKKRPAPPVTLTKRNSNRCCFFLQFKQAPIKPDDHVQTAYFGPAI